MIDWPSCADNCSNTVRGVTSVALPAVSGTITRIGRAGQVSAAAMPASANSATTGTATSGDKAGAIFLMMIPHGERATRAVLAMLNTFRRYWRAAVRLVHRCPEEA